MSLVEGQLQAFVSNMERDSASQRAECGAAVGAAAARGGAFIDDTLQLGNTEALTTFVFGSKRSQGTLPAAAGAKGFRVCQCCTSVAACLWVKTPSDCFMAKAGQERVS